MTYAPSSAIWFCTYDVFKEYLRGRKSQMLRLVGLQEVEPRAWATGLHLVSGGVAGAAAAIFTNPLDVARTRQMCMDATNPHDKALLELVEWASA